jgi:hypothetical protein
MVPGSAFAESLGLRCFLCLRRLAIMIHDTKNSGNWQHFTQKRPNWDDFRQHLQKV